MQNRGPRPVPWPWTQTTRQAREINKHLTEQFNWKAKLPLRIRWEKLSHIATQFNTTPAMRAFCSLQQSTAARTPGHLSQQQAAVKPRAWLEDSKVSQDHQSRPHLDVQWPGLESWAGPCHGTLAWSLPLLLTPLQLKTEDQPCVLRHTTSSRDSPGPLLS